MVIRRLAALVLAAVFALAPVAIEACQATCARQTATSVATPAAEQHSCHHMAPSRSAGSTGMRGVPHNCAHSTDLPTACGTVWLSGFSTLAVVPVVTFYRPPIHDAARYFDTAPSISPPRVANAGQLRV